MIEKRVLLWVRKKLYIGDLFAKGIGAAYVLINTRGSWHEVGGPTLIPLMK